ncbi:MAG: hypothetical protein MI919_16825 [Holophagales bacterium]|nr:hypothetical protein [Holophagales bacterium]
MPSFSAVWMGLHLGRGRAGGLAVRVNPGTGDHHAVRTLKGGNSLLGEHAGRDVEPCRQEEEGEVWEGGYAVARF